MYYNILGMREPDMLAGSCLPFRIKLQEEAKFEDLPSTHSDHVEATLHDDAQSSLSMQLCLETSDKSYTSLHESFSAEMQNSAHDEKHMKKKNST